MTGYLTQKGSINRELYNLAIPNREIRNIMTDHILNLFKEQVAADGELLNNFCDALENGQQEMVEALFSEYLKKTISIRDTFVQKPTKENFYHGILLGILGFKAGWSVSSNRETGNGYSDIQIQIDDLEKECREALQQIQTKEYTDFFKDSDIHTVLKYGITCNRKKCRVMMEKEKL